MSLRLARAAEEIGLDYLFLADAWGPGVLRDGASRRLLSMTIFPWQ